MVLPTDQSPEASLNGITIAPPLADAPIEGTSVAPGVGQTGLTPIDRAQAPLTPEQTGTVGARVPSGTCPYLGMKMNDPFEQAVRQHGETVLRVCRAVLGSGADAENAWSETFLAALGAWPDLDDDTNVQAWLVRVAHRKAIDVVRARARQAAPIGDLPDQRSRLGNPGDDEHGVWAAVAALPERQRLAVAYHFFGGLPHAETAELIGGTPDAVRRAAADGIKRLRRTYADDATRGTLR